MTGLVWNGFDFDWQPRKRSEPAKMPEITLGNIGIRSGDQDDDEYQLRPCYQAKTQGPPTFSPETKIRD